MRKVRVFPPLSKTKTPQANKEYEEVFEKRVTEIKSFQCLAFYLVFGIQKGGVPGLLRPAMPVGAEADQGQREDDCVPEAMATIKSVIEETKVRRKVTLCISIEIRTHGSGIRKI